ncbi:MAG: kinase [Alphaproteobacteria bacterium]|nr:kinase [Alphaproteobacteria bacterium]
MIISRTPFRVSLFGGGSDYPPWYRQHGGAVLGMTINKYCYITIRPLPPFFEHRHRIVYSRIELVKTTSEIDHPSVRAVLTEMNIREGLEIHHDGDLPARSGLGSSSSFTVGLLNALNAYEGRMMSKKRLADEAIRIEQDVIKENVGSQDQVWAAYGGLNRINFRTDDSIGVVPIITDDRKRHQLQESMLLFFTGLARNASTIAGDKIANLEKKAQQIRTMVQMVDEAQAILQNPRRSINEIGQLLHDSWQLKRELAASITSSTIDDIYEAGRKAGAIGGKLLGAGGGGFMLFFVEPDKRPSVIKALGKLIPVPVEIGRDGSRIIVYEPDEHRSMAQNGQAQ